VAGQPVWVWPAAGPRWLLLHGFTGSPLSWRKVAGLVASRAALVAPALPGHDGGASHGGPGTFQGAVDELAGVVGRIGPGPWRVAGYSMGGRLALGLLVAHPGLFERGVLIGASSGLAAAGERHERRRSDARWSELLRSMGVAAFLAEWEKLPLFASQDDLPPQTLAEQREMRVRHDAEGLARALEVLGLGGMPDLAPALAAVSTPVTLVAGEADEKFVLSARMMSERLPAATVQIVPGCGHNVVLERPQVVVEILLAAAGGGAGEGRG